MASQSISSTVKRLEQLPVVRSNTAQVSQVQPVQQPMTMQKGLPVQQDERRLLNLSDTIFLMKQIQATHIDPDGHFPEGTPIDVDTLITAAETALKEDTAWADATLDIPGNDEELEALTILLADLADDFGKVDKEISHGGKNVQATAMEVLKTLSKYSWDSKMVIAIVAIVVKEGELWRMQVKKRKNKSLESDPLFKALNILIEAIIDLTNCVIGFAKLVTQHHHRGLSAISTTWTHVPIAVYHTIRCIIVFTFQVTSLGRPSSSTELSFTYSQAWEISTSVKHLNNIQHHLEEQKNIFNQHIDEKNQAEAYQDLICLLEKGNYDNTKTLWKLFYAYESEDMLPLYEGGSSKNRVNLEVLRKKHVLLLISDLDITNKEISILDKMYKKARQQPNGLESLYEVVWLPVVDDSTHLTEEEKLEKFEMPHKMMPWYSVCDPNILVPVGIKCIKEVWHFARKTILVVLDPQGKVINQNAHHMVWIWRNEAFPFNNLKEDALWGESERWTLDLLVDDIDQNILKWKDEQKLICLYGGEDMDWIREFTTAARTVSQAIQTPIELVYVGKSYPTERIKQNNIIISNEKLSHIWPDLTNIWYFWVRLESMWHSKVREGKAVENDPIMQEIMVMLGFDGSNEGWAVISKGPNQMAKANEEKMLTSFGQIEKWKEHVETKGFVSALNDYLDQLDTPHRCNHLILPLDENIKHLPDVECAECGNPWRSISCLVVALIEERHRE